MTTAGLFLHVCEPAFLQAPVLLGYFGYWPCVFGISCILDNPLYMPWKGLAEEGALSAQWDRKRFLFVVVCNS